MDDRICSEPFREGFEAAKGFGDWLNPWGDGEAGAEFDRGYKAAEFFDSLTDWKKDYLKKLDDKRLACI